MTYTEVALSACTCGADRLAGTIEEREHKW